MSVKNKAFFLVGNYGCGKSSIIKETVTRQESIFLEIRPNLWVVGTQINGADSLSQFAKENVLKTIIENKDKNVIIAGNYYCQIKDIEILSKHFSVVLVYLKTTFENNAKRIAERGKLINVDTFNNKLKNHISMISKTNGLRKLYIIDNNQELKQTKQEFFNITENEINRIS